MAALQMSRSLPWRQPTNERRKAEQVRPIFWANRPKSYINRTSDWDKYPQGRYRCCLGRALVHITCRTVGLRFKGEFAVRQVHL